MKRYIYALTTIVSCILIAACGGPPGNNPLLSEAQREYQLANSDSQIVANAPVQLKKAEQALSKGEDLARQGAEEDVVAHYAYLAKQRTAIAKEMTRLSVAESEIDRAELERKETLLAVREREAKRAKVAAEQAKEVAESATEVAAEAVEEAVESKQEAQVAKKQAQDKALEAEAAKAAAATAIQSAHALAQRVAELEARETERGLVITLSDILFEFDKADLKPGADRALSELATFLREYGDRNLLIEGFTDSIGSHAYNEDLSRRRADAVRRALIAKGISDTRIRTRGLGEDYPVAGNDTEAGRQQNRRVEIVISDESGEIPNRSS